MEIEKQKNIKGFTLIEMLVVVLIIGILAGIALPQYQMAVTKAKVASILPIMRRWKDALQEYKLQNGSYVTEDEDYPDADTLGTNWPSDWECPNVNIECGNGYWNCFANEDSGGEISCLHDTNDGSFSILMYQADDQNCEACQGKILCQANGTEGNKVCKALGGKILEGTTLSFDVYSL